MDELVHDGNLCLLHSASTSVQREIHTNGVGRRKHSGERKRKTGPGAFAVLRWCTASRLPQHQRQLDCVNCSNDTRRRTGGCTRYDATFDKWSELIKSQRIFVFRLKIMSFRLTHIRSAPKSLSSIETAHLFE